MISKNALVSIIVPYNIFLLHRKQYISEGMSSTRGVFHINTKRISIECTTFPIPLTPMK